MDTDCQASLTWPVLPILGKLRSSGWQGRQPLRAEHPEGPRWRGSAMAYLVRHAHAGDKHQWVGPDQDRPLSVAGQGEARGLLTRLGGYRISRILSGPAIRCQQTVVPLAARFGLPVELIDDLVVKAAADQLLGLVTDPALGTAVLCSHGEVIGQVLQQLVAGGLVLADPLRWEKGVDLGPRQQGRCSGGGPVSGAASTSGPGGVLRGSRVWRTFQSLGLGLVRGGWSAGYGGGCRTSQSATRGRCPCSIGRSRGLPSAVTESAPPWDGRGSCVPADRPSRSAQLGP
jgi:phosphohistidine phosphatase SixA